MKAMLHLKTISIPAETITGFGVEEEKELDDPKAVIARWVKTGKWEVVVKAGDSRCRLPGLFESEEEARGWMVHVADALYENLGPFDAVRQLEVYKRGL